MNGTMWKAITLPLKSKELIVSQWELVPLRTATSAGSYEQLFLYTRSSTSGISLPTWFTIPMSVVSCSNGGPSKYDHFVDEVEMPDCSPTMHALVSRMQGRTPPHFVSWHLLVVGLQTPHYGRRWITQALSQLLSVYAWRNDREPQKAANDDVPRTVFLWWTCSH